jgi:hypothetical protein
MASNAFDDFELTPLDVEPDTVGNYTRARLEGFYAHALVRGTTHLTAEDVAKWQKEAAVNTGVYDPEGEMQAPFVVPDTAIYVLRLALRVLARKGGTSQEERSRAIEAIGDALVTVEEPE